MKALIAVIWLAIILIVGFTYTRVHDYKYQNCLIQPTYTQWPNGCPL